VAKNTGNDYTTWLFNGAVAAIFLAGVGALGFDIYLASTQWILVAILLVSLANYFKK
jgi:Na+/proline symporter